MTGNSKKGMVCDAPYLPTSSVTPDFFYIFNIILSLSFSTCSQSFKKNLYVGTFGRERPQKKININVFRRASSEVLSVVL